MYMCELTHLCYIEECISEGRNAMNLARHEKIIEIMEQQNTISVRELAQKLGCTEMTVRRNLDQLQEKQLIRREHGYAYLLKPAMATDYYAQVHENASEKEAIARAALPFIAPGMSICLDSGTTVQKLVEILPADLACSVITPSLIAAMTLSSRKDIPVYIPGGFLHHSNRSLLIDSVQELSRYHADIAFLSCRSFQLPGGTFEHSQTLTQTKRALAEIADRRILLLDYSKWNIRSIFNCIPLERIDLIITDDKAPAQHLQELSRLGKQVIVAAEGH